MSIIAADQAESTAQSTETTYQYVREAEGIFRHTATKWLHERPTINGKRTWKSLKTKNLKLAKEEFRRRRSAEDRGENPYAEKQDPPADEEKKKAASLVGDALRCYDEDDCPDRNRKKRPALMLAAEKANVEILLPFWDAVIPDDITIALCDKYHDKRVEEITRGEGDRTVDLELNTLRNALRWGCRCELIKHMPLPEGWPRYHTGTAVHHCREFMAHDADEVHQIASHLFRHGKSRVLGFQFVFENNTGLRTIEALRLRTDAEPFTEGWISPDGKSLCVRRAKGQSNVNPFVAVHDGLKEWLEAHKRWKEEFYPDSPWYFPSPYDPSQPADISALSHALCRLRKPSGRGKKKQPAKIKRKIISHGCRAFYVTVRRSHGISDVQIGWELGHTSLGKTLADVYGGVPPHWLIGDGPKMSWLPTGKRVWAETEELERTKPTGN
jgi:integrase